MDLGKGNFHRPSRLFSCCLRHPISYCRFHSHHTRRIPWPFRLVLLSTGWKLSSNNNFATRSFENTECEHEGRYIELSLLIAALIFSAAYYSAPIFLQFKEFELYWGAVFLRLEEEYWRSPFYDSKRSIGVLFFNQFYWSDFWSGIWNAWKNLEWFWCWTEVKSGAKREWFLFIPLFLREREIDVWKNFLKASETFLFTCCILKQFFSFILVKRFGYDFVLISGWFR